MSATSIIVLVAVVLVLLVLLGLIVGSARRRSLADDRARADQLRRHAHEDAADIPDARERVAAAEADAEEARRRAEAAEERADEERVALHQQEAAHEDRLRAADRLDPDVDHRADDYAPEAADPAGPGRPPLTDEGQHRA